MTRARSAEIEHRIRGDDVVAIGIVRELVGSLLVLALGTSLALEPRARAAAAVGIVLLVASHVPPWITPRLATADGAAAWMMSAAAVVLTTVGAWLALAVALRRARPAPSPPIPPIAETFA